MISYIIFQSVLYHFFISTCGTVVYVRVLYCSLGTRQVYIYVHVLRHSFFSNFKIILLVDGITTSCFLTLDKLYLHVNFWPNLLNSGTPWRQCPCY